MIWRRRVKGAVTALWPAAAALFLCEYLVYFFVLWRCGYPQLAEQPSSSTSPPHSPPLRAMFLADTHLLGSREGHWFDKLRREWQMRRAFQTARTLFSPDLIVFLGDVFDEGKWCGPDEFKAYLARFEELFWVGEGTEVRVVAGNHDMGFHYAVTPYLKTRFERAFAAPSVDRFSVKGINFVSVNSMAMEGDGCFLCADGAEKLEKVSRELSCMKDRDECELDYELDGSDYSAPILLQHFPLYRPSDSECDEPDEAPPGEKDKKFRQNWDCLSKESTKTLLEKVRPRLVLSGHTHHGCRVAHGPDTVPEWSVSSFSWRNRNNPTFLLATITAEDFALEKCYMPEESTVINLYWLFGVSYAVALFRRKCLNKRRSFG